MRGVIVADITSGLKVVSIASDVHGLCRLGRKSMSLPPKKILSG